MAPPERSKDGEHAGVPPSTSRRPTRGHPQRLRLLVGVHDSLPGVVVRAPDSSWRLTALSLALVDDGTLLRFTIALAVVPSRSGD